MSRNDVKQFVKATSTLRLENDKFKAATKDLTTRKKELRAQLKNLLPTGSFRAGEFVVTTLKRSSYKGISELLVRNAIAEHYGSADITDAVLSTIAINRKGPESKHVVVSQTSKTTTAGPTEVHALLAEFGAVEKQMKQYKDEFNLSVSNLKSTVSSFESPVAVFMSGGSDTRNISISLENGLIEKWKLKRCSTRLPITIITLKQALQQATGNTVHDYADAVINILDENRKTCVKLTHPRIQRAY